MKVVILAAGLGTRTQSFSSLPKPAVQVLGKSLLEWSFASFHSLRASGLIGTKDFFVIVSPEVALAPEVIEITHRLGLKLLITSGSTVGPAETALQATSQLISAGLIQDDEPIIFSDCDH